LILLGTILSVILWFSKEPGELRSRLEDTSFIAAVVVVDSEERRERREKDGEGERNKGCDVINNRHGLDQV